MMEYECNWGDTWHPNEIYKQIRHFLWYNLGAKLDERKIDYLIIKNMNSNASNFIYYYRNKNVDC